MVIRRYMMECSFVDYDKGSLGGFHNQFFNTGFGGVVKIKEEKTGLKIDDDVIRSPTKFFLLASGMYPYEWQSLLLNDDSQEISVRVGRQGGKTETIALKALHTALMKPRYNILIISPTMEQSRILFKKIEQYMLQYDFIKRYIKSNTKTEIYFTNGSNIFVKAGSSVRGYTINMIICDEAAYVDENVFVAAEPALMATNGRIILISTPFGKLGKFYESFTDLHYSTYHVPSWKIPHIPNHKLERAKELMSNSDFLREHEAEFIEAAGAWFPLQLIKDNCFMWEELPLSPRRGHKYYLGVDVSRAGSDETVYCIWEVSNVTKTKRLIYIWEDIEVTTAPHIEGMIIDLHKKWNFTNICIDATGMGGFLIDNLPTDELPITPIIFNAKSPIGGERSHKTEMYSMWKTHMERNQRLREHNDKQMKALPLCGIPEKDAEIKKQWNLKPYILMLKSDTKLMNQMMDLKYEWRGGGELSLKAATERIHDDFCDAAALGYYAIFIDPHREMVSAAALGKR